MDIRRPPSSNFHTPVQPLNNETLKERGYRNGITVFGNLFPSPPGHQERGIHVPRTGSAANVSSLRRARTNKKFHLLNYKHTNSPFQAPVSRLSSFPTYTTPAPHAQVHSDTNARAMGNRKTHESNGGLQPDMPLESEEDKAFIQAKLKELAQNKEKNTTFVEDELNAINKEEAQNAAFVQDGLNKLAQNEKNKAAELDLLKKQLNAELVEINKMLKKKGGSTQRQRQRQRQTRRQKQKKQ